MGTRRPILYHRRNLAGNSPGRGIGRGPERRGSDRHLALKRTIGSIAAVALTRGLGLILALGISVLLAGNLGAGASTDAFFFARRITVGLSEALSRVAGMVLIPDLVSALKSMPTAAVAALWRRQLTRISALSLLGAIAAAWAAPLIVSTLGPGLEGERAELAVRVLRIMVFLIPAALFLAVSKSLFEAGKRFWVPAALSLVPRTLVVLCLLLMIPPWGVESLAWALVAGSILAGVALLVILLKRLPALQREFATGTARLAKDAGGRLWPSLLIHGHGQAIVWIDLAFASTVGTGALSVLEYGTRMMTIMPGLLSASLVTVMYTEYSHRSLDGSGGALQRSLMRTTRGGLFLLAPLIGIIALLGNDIVALLLQRGAFDAEAARLTVSVMRFLAPAMVFSFMVNNLLSALYADPAAPRLKILSVAISVALAFRVTILFVLVGRMGVAGVALGNSLSSLCLLLALYPLIRRQWGGFLTRSDARSFAGIILSTAISLALVYVVRSHVGAAQGLGVGMRVLSLLGYGGLGAGCYFGVTLLLRLREMTAARDLLSRRSR
jgi:putative peptidoglycan lipid II flippase